MELRFTVWQFVRLMVHIEAHPNACFDDWQDVWTTVDQELTSLAESNPDAYGEMMMNQDVVIEKASTVQVRAAQSALKAVMTELDAIVASSSIKEDADDQGQSEHLQSLKFERRGLRQLTRKLGKLGKLGDQGL